VTASGKEVTGFCAGLGGRTGGKCDPDFFSSPQKKKKGSDSKPEKMGVTHPPRKRGCYVLQQNGGWPTDEPTGRCFCLGGPQKPLFLGKK